MISMKIRIGEQGLISLIAARNMFGGKVPFIALTTIWESHGGTVSIHVHLTRKVPF